MKDYVKISSCRICKNKNLKRVLNLGSTPPANSFLKKLDLRKKEPFFPLQLFFCNNCKLVQLGHVVSPELLFRKYLYVSSTSPLFIKHFEEYASSVFKRFCLNKNSLVVDIGSNDGILLRPFKKLGTKVLGVDPAEEIAEKATKEGLTTLPYFLNRKVASEISDKYGIADVICANNVFAHVNDLDELTKAVKIILKPDGVFIIEAPYLIDFLEKNLFDLVYHEHLSYLAIKPLNFFFKKHGMRIFDVIKTSSHGGSIRVFVKKNSGKNKILSSAKKFINEETLKGLGKEKTFLDFADKIEGNKKELLNLLKSIKNQGKTIVGYGAPAKGNTLLNYFGIDTKILDYIIDDSPLKQGLFTPGTHIPVYSSERLNKDPKPNYIFILAWNFAQPIIEKLASFSEQGGKFIVPVPTPEIIQDKRFISKSIVEEDIKNIISDLGKDALKLSGKTVLISGGSGFLGSYINQTINLLNERVLKRKCYVISVDNYITGSEKKNFLGEIKSNKFEFIQHDVRLPLNIKRKVDYIVHAAGLASPFYYQKYPLETIESAVLGAKNLLELCRLKRVKSFLFFSSSEIYGNPDSKHVPTREDYAGHVSSVGPRACYDESKRLAETLSLVYYQQFGVPVKIVRPFNIYGPGMKPDDYRVIPTFISKALSGEPLPVHDRGTQTRTFCYVTDAVTGFLKVLLSEKNGEVYNIGNEKPEITIYDLAVAVSKISPKKVIIKKIEYPPSYPAGEPQRRCPDLTKSRTILGYEPKVDLITGLQRSIDWFQSEHGK